MGPGHPPEWVDRLLAENSLPENGSLIQNDVDITTDDMQIPDQPESAEDCYEMDCEQANTPSEDGDEMEYKQVIVSEETNEDHDEIEQEQADISK